MAGERIGKERRIFYRLTGAAGAALTAAMGMSEMFRRVCWRGERERERGEQGEQKATLM